MCKRINREKLENILYPLIFLSAGLLIWEYYVYFFNIPQWLLPRPSIILIDFIFNLKFYLDHFIVTMTTAIIGFFAAIIVSLLVATIFIHSKIIEKGLWPIILALRITPILAITPILIIFFGTGLNSKIIIAALISFFPILVNFINGLKSVDHDSLDLFKSFSSNKLDIFLKLRLPSSLQDFFSGLKISSLLAITGAFIGEFIASNKGIGYLIVTSARTFDLVTSFSAILSIILGGFFLFGIISLIEKRVIYWKYR